MYAQHQQQQQHVQQKSVRLKICSIREQQQQSSASVFALDFEKRRGGNDLSASGWKRLARTKIIEFEEFVSAFEAKQSSSSTLKPPNHFADNDPTDDDHQQNKLYGRMIKLEEEKKEIKQLLMYTKLEKELNTLKNEQTALKNEHNSLKNEHTALKNEHNELLAKVSKMDQQQQEKQGQLQHQQQKVPGKDTANQRQRMHQQIAWDVNACHADLSIFGVGCVANMGEENGWRSVFAKCSILRLGYFYFEIKILSLKFCFVIGLSKGVMPMDAFAAETPYTYSYISNGYVRLLDTFKPHKSEFCAGDVIGCGADFNQKQMFFTKNGRIIDADNLFATSSVAFCPFVSLYSNGDLVEANFGPNFKFNISTIRK
ncbi:hypothetical protein niasHS_016060 [Heterodera schachtii]|uniref:B30.2/SPRY domain-containing protein n=1 Tax=Heterodera schachtii TaxID=97005 RepID=A0ABD2HVT5_HETSC